MDTLRSLRFQALHLPTSTDKTFPAFPGSGSALDGAGGPVWILGVIPLALRKRCLAGETVGLGCGSRFWAKNEGFTKGPGLAPSSFSYIASHTWRFGGVPERWGRQKESGRSILHTVEVKLYVCKMDELVNEFKFVQFSWSKLHESLLGGLPWGMDCDGLCSLLYLQGLVHISYLIYIHWVYEWRGVNSCEARMSRSWNEGVSHFNYSGTGRVVKIKQ